MEGEALMAAGPVAGAWARAAAGALLVAAAPAQGGDKIPKWRIDPYTKNDKQLMDALGYVSYGPFEFGSIAGKPVTTADIDKFLSYDQILWVETRHFRIGTSLRDYTVPFEPETKAKIRGELTRLVEKLPSGRVNPKALRLDPWLRLHLIAMRMEDLYADVQSWLGVKDADFPQKRGEVIAGKGTYMGYGPFMGQDNKYLIFLPEKGTTYLDYLKRYIGRTGRFGQRWNFKEVGSLFYGIGGDMEDGRLKHDTAMHSHLCFNIAHNLIDGFRFYSYDLPVWIKEGIGHWFQRQVSEKWNDFDQNEGNLADMKTLWRWQPETRQLLTNGKGAPLSEVMKWRDYGEIKFDDHVLIWSRIDFMMSMGKERFSKFMFLVKGRVEPGTWLPDMKDLVGATRDALQEAYQLSPLSFDEKWKEWVIKTYAAQ
jgi:hypothetical protein